MNLLKSTSGLVALALLAAATLFAKPPKETLFGDLQGLDKIYSTNFNASSPWRSVNLKGWGDLDLIPARAVLKGGPATNEQVTITFPLFNHGRPGFEDLYFISNSPNVIVTQPPTLSVATAPGEEVDGTYTLRITVTDNQTAYIYFFAKLMDGAHVNPGSSLHIRGEPSLSPLQIHKIGEGDGGNGGGGGNTNSFPDLVITKSAPAQANPGDVITYTIAYTNEAAVSNDASGVVITDILPPALNYVNGSATGSPTLLGNTLIWNIGTVVAGTGGMLSYQARVSSFATNSQQVANTVIIRSNENNNDTNSTNNTNVVITVVVGFGPQNDTYTTPEDTALTVPAPGVLANDTPPLGTNYQALLVTPPLHGTVTLNPDGSFTYVPATNFFGTDTFVYAAVTPGASSGLNATVTINVTAVNDPPSVAIISPTNGTVFIAPATFNIVVDATDPENNITSVTLYTACNEPGGLCVLQTFSAPPYVYTMSNLPPGTYQFVASATDAGGLTDVSEIVTVTVIEQPNFAFAGPISLNRQNGLFEQNVFITNTTAQPWNGLRVYVSGLEPGQSLYNATGTNIGVAYVELSETVAAGSVAEVLLQFYSTSGLPAPQIQIAVNTVARPALPSLSVMAAKPKKLTNGHDYVEFSSVSQRFYFVQRSTDSVNWATVSGPLAGTGKRIQWSSNSTKKGRYRYRVLIVP